MNHDRWHPSDGACPLDMFARAGTPMQQHPLYLRTCAALGAGGAAFLLGDRDAPQGWAQILLRRWPLLGEVAMLARGPVFDPAVTDAARRDATRMLLDDLRDHYRAVMATPDPIGGVEPLAGAGWLALMSGGTMARLELSTDADVMRAAMHGKWRNRLVRAERAGLRLRIAPMGSGDADWLLQREDAQAAERGYRRLPAAFIRAWVREGGRDAAMLAVAEHGGTPLVGMIFLRHGTGASYQMGWTGAEGRSRDAHRLLLYHAALHLAQAGHETLDLGSLDTVTTPGLARFKLGAGAVPVTLGATRIMAPGSRMMAWLAGDSRRHGRAPLPRTRRGTELAPW